MKFYSHTIRHLFDNGMEVYMLPRPGGAVEVECFIRTGGIHEGEFLGYGVSHFLEHMLFQGCAGYPEQAVAAAIRELGGSINACTGCEYTMVNAQAGGGHLSRLVEIIAAMVRFPELPPAKFELEKQVILRECDRCHDQVSRLVMEEMLRTMFPLHPLRHPVCGYSELVAECRCEMLREYHARRYTPDRCFWVLTGDFDPASAVEMLERCCGDWKRGGLNEPALISDPAPRSSRSAEICFPDPLDRLALAVRLPSDGSLDDAADVLFGTLGMGASSRLVDVLELREKLAVDVQALCCSLAGFGIGAVSVSAVPSKLDRLERRLMDELAAVRNGELSRGAVEREKSQKYAELLRQTTDPRMVAANIGGAVLGGESPAECDRRIERMSALSVDDLRHAARILLDPDGFTVVRQRSKPRSVSFAARRASEESKPIIGSSGILTATDRSVPLVRMSLAMPGGVIFESAAAPGASALCASWLTAGTGRLTESEFMARMESCGAEISVNSGLNSLVLSLSAPRRSFARALKLAGEMLGNPRFGDPEFERERSRLVEYCRCQDQSPLDSALKRAQSVLFGTHPYARGRGGSEETLAALRPDAVREFYRSLLYPDRMFTAFGGDCSESEAERWRGELLSGVKWSSSAPGLPAAPVFPCSAERIDFTLPREQSAVVLALPGVALGAEIDRRTDILQQCENGLASHLFRRVREDNALSYSVGMTMNGGFHRGGLYFYALTSEAGAEPALKLLLDEAERLAVAGVGDDEFFPARESAAFESDRILENQSSLVESAALELYYGTAADFIRGRGGRLRSETPENFNTLLRKLFADFRKSSVSVIARGGA